MTLDQVTLLITSLGTIATVLGAVLPQDWRFTKACHWFGLKLRGLGK